jgi:hypothetical protein
MVTRDYVKKWPRNEGKVDITKQSTKNILITIDKLYLSLCFVVVIIAGVYTYDDSIQKVIYQNRYFDQASATVARDKAEPKVDKTTRKSDPFWDDADICMDEEGNAWRGGNSKCYTIADLKPANFGVAIGKFLGELFGVIMVLLLVRFWVKWLFKQFTLPEVKEG